MLYFGLYFTFQPISACTSLFSLAYIAFWPTVRHFFGPLYVTFWPCGHAHKWTPPPPPPPPHTHTHTHTSCHGPKVILGNKKWKDTWNLLIFLFFIKSFCGVNYCEILVWRVHSDTHTRAFQYGWWQTVFSVIRQWNCQMSTACVSHHEDLQPVWVLGKIYKVINVDPG